MEHALNVGESAIIKRSFPWISWTLGYAGMPGDSTFSLFVQDCQGKRAFAYNVFFPNDQREVALAGGTFVVEEVSATGIRLRSED